MFYNKPRTLEIEKEIDNGKHEILNWRALYYQNYPCICCGTSEVRYSRVQ